MTSQGRPENLGLGLFVAQSIARNHRGHITAEDLSDGQGARFVVRLPEGGAKQTARSEEALPGLPALVRRNTTAIEPRD